MLNTIIKKLYNIYNNIDEGIVAETVRLCEEETKNKIKKLNQIIQMLVEYILESVDFQPDEFYNNCIDKDGNITTDSVIAWFEERVNRRNKNG